MGSASIGSLQRENEKLKMAQELNKESAEDFEELVVERDQLQTDLSSKSAELEGLRGDVLDGQTVIETQISKLAQLEIVITTARADSTFHEQAAAAQIARVLEVQRDLETERQISQDHQKDAVALKTEADALRSRAAYGDAISQSLIVEIAGQRQRLTHAIRAWRGASAALHVKTTALDTTSAQIDKLNAQVDSFDAERTAMAQQLESFSQRGRMLDTANEKIRDLEGQLQTLQGECGAMAEQLDSQAAAEADLASKLSTATVDLEAYEQARARIQSLEQDLAAARDAATRLSHEIAGVRAELLDGKDAQARAATDFEQRLQLATAETESAQQSLAGKIAELEGSTRELVETQRRVEELQGRLAVAEESVSRSASDKATEVTAAQTEMATLRTSLEEATTRAYDLQSTCDGLKTTINQLNTQLEDVSSSSTDRTLALQSANAELERAVSAGDATADALRTEVVAMAKKHEHLSVEFAGLQQRLADAQETARSHTAEKGRLDGEVDSLRSQIEEHSSKLSERDLALRQT